MELLSELISIVAPPRCPVCRGAADDARAGLCAGCRAQLPWRSAGACRRCGLDEHRHARCPGRGGAVARAWAPMAYEGVARRLVHELKFHGRLALVDDVHTTGATLEQCARALRGAGARWVAGVTYARAL